MATVTDAREALRLLQQFTDAANHLAEVSRRFRVMQAEYEAAMREYRYTAQTVVGIAETLQIKPRGGPGSWGL
jgi:7-keto-8-aminopelargonate synthetase-like enzyme